MVLMARLQSKYDAPVTDLEVNLLAAERVVGTVSTGELGEFELPLQDSSRFELEIDLGEDRRLGARLGDSG